MDERDFAALGPIVAGVLEDAYEKQKVFDEDYINPDDGLLYCGKCHTPKRRKAKHPFKPDSEFIVPCYCKCEQETEDERRRRKEEQERDEYIHNLKITSLMDDKFKSQTFESFRTTKENEKIFRLCKRYSDNFEEMLKNNQGLLFYGDVGTGKTFAAACIANDLLNRKISVVMTSFAKLMEKARSFKADDEEVSRKLDSTKLLIIDDLGVESGSDFALEKVYTYIDNRYRSNMPMILTTNLELSEMQRTNDIRYRRIYDRIFEMCYPVRFTGASFRKIEAKKRFDAMKTFLEGD